MRAFTRQAPNCTSASVSSYYIAHGHITVHDTRWITLETVSIPSLNFFGQFMDFRNV